MDFAQLANSYSEVGFYFLILPSRAQYHISCAGAQNLPWKQKGSIPCSAFPGIEHYSGRTISNS